LVLQSFVHLNGALASDYLEPAATSSWPRALTEQSQPNLPVTASSKLPHRRVATLSLVIHSYQRPGSHRSARANVNYAQGNPAGQAAIAHGKASQSRVGHGLRYYMELFGI
jgi:hypothetical protein